VHSWAPIHLVFCDAVLAHDHRAITPPVQAHAHARPSK
jgi:hypothetical protein